MRSRRLKAEDYRNINIIIIPDEANIDLIISLFEHIRFIKFKHNNINPQVNDKCWVRGKDSSVYTTIKYNNKKVHAHRVSYEIFKGRRILNFGCHHCDIKACINPNHIFDGTQRQNMLDGRRKRRIFGISINNNNMISRAEKRLRNTYPNVSMQVSRHQDDLRERLQRAIRNG